MHFPKTGLAATDRLRRWLVATTSALLLVGCGGGGGEGPGGGTDTLPVVPDDPASCKAAKAAMSDTVWPALKDRCVTCHITGASGGGTGLVFKSREPDVDNFRVLQAYAAKNGKLLLEKSIGAVRHTGGAPFVNAASAEYAALRALLPMLEVANCPTSGAGPGDGVGGVKDVFWSGVEFEAPTATLSRAAVLLAGRMPTTEERDAVSRGNAGVLRSTIRSYMSGTTFDEVILETGELKFLVPTVFVLASEEDGGLNPADWPLAGPVLKAEGSTPASDDTIARFGLSLRYEPVELLKFIVNNDRPYTDIVAGNYTVANGVIGVYLGAKFKDGTTPKVDDPVWREATLPDVRNGTREHSGVLSTQAWLQRFPTTDTNRNRHRVNSVFKQFLATDIEAFAKRPVDDTNTSFKVPVIENPACSVCHSVMDPIAAGFQNWNERNRFRPEANGGTPHALPETYLDDKYPKDVAGERYYQVGDNWFRDQATPGYGASAMPGGYMGSTNALQWMGQQVASDPRFARGAVDFFYEGLFGIAPLQPPEGATYSAQYMNDLAAYKAQSEEFDAIAARFTKDQGYGPYNVKDLLVDLLSSRLVTAASVARSSDTNIARQKRALGAVYLLPPSQIDRRLTQLVGYHYEEFRDPFDGLGLTYSGFDGGNAVNRAQQFTLMRSLIAERMSLQVSCMAVFNDFNRTKDKRMLFRSAELATTPETPAGKDVIMTNIRFLQQMLWRHDAKDSELEVQRTYKLFTTLLANKPAANEPQQDECKFNSKNDAAYTGRAWSTVLAYLLGDPEFLMR